MCLNGYPGVVLNVELAKLNCPLDHSPSCLGLVHGLLDGLICYYQDRVHLKVRSQLTRSYYWCKCNLFDPGIPGFYSLEGLTDVVNWELFFVFIEIDEGRVKWA